MGADPGTVQEAVRRNFDASPTEYELFEARTGLFKSLARSLADQCGIERGMTVVDVGAGTGISSDVLAQKVCPEGRVVLVENSQTMLQVARKRMFEHGDHAVFVQKGAWEPYCAPGTADAVFFNASIFLIPEPERAIRRAVEALRPGGVLAFDYMLGSYVMGRELRIMLGEDAPELAPYGRPINDVKKLEQAAASVGLSTEASGEIQRILSWEEAREFYIIPAMAAGLFPREGPEERFARVTVMFEYLRDKGEFVQRWSWQTARKTKL